MHSYKSKKKTIILFMIVFAALCLTFNTVFGGGFVTTGGMLTSIEKDNIIIIDTKGYLVSAAVRVIDYEGKSITLKRISLPARIDFTYEYTAVGPMIRSIKVYPEEIPQ